MAPATCARLLQCRIPSLHRRYHSLFRHPTTFFARRLAPHGSSDRSGCPCCADIASAGAQNSSVPYRIAGAASVICASIPRDRQAAIAKRPSRPTSAFPDDCHAAARQREHHRHAADGRCRKEYRAGGSGVPIRSLAHIDGVAVRLRSLAGSWPFDARLRRSRRAGQLHQQRHPRHWIAVFGVIC